MKISLLVPDFSTNCVGRAYILARVLQRSYQVEVIGPAFGSGIWPPADTGEIDYRPILNASKLSLTRIRSEITDLISGQVIYAVKPLNTSFGSALAAKRCRKLPVVLDIDDWEFGAVKWLLRRYPKTFITEARHPNWHGWTLLLDRLTWLANKKTVSNLFLARKYGGYLLPHGQDTAFLDPEKYEQTALKQQLGAVNKKIILFLGTPRPHKGIEKLLDAVSQLKNPTIMVLMVGVDHNDPYAQRLRQKGNGFLHQVGMTTLLDRPRWLAMADIVVLPSPVSSVAAGQIPAKLFDAMAMARPIIATDVSDTASILQDCGYIVSPGDVHQLAEMINYVLTHPAEAASRGWAARQKCEAQFSWDKMEQSLREIFGEYE